jgi:hypothetical protein
VKDVGVKDVEDKMKEVLQLDSHRGKNSDKEKIMVNHFQKDG